MAGKEKVTNSLVEDKARRDASYEYSKSSKEPVAEGAFKGALTSGLTARFIPAAKKGGSNWKKQAANLVAGVAGGALAGKVYNDKKVEKAQAARRWLSDKKKENEYAHDAKVIYKDASFVGEQVDTIKKDPYGAAVAAAEDSRPKKRTLGAIVKDSIGGAGLGAVLGLATKGKARGLSIKRGAAIGGAGIAASDIVEGESSDTGLTKSRPGQIAGMGASFAASGAVEPLVNRALGRYSKDKNAIVAERAASAKPKKGMFGFGKAKKTTTEFMKGHATKGKAASSLFKGLGKPTLKSAGRYGALGIGAGLLLDKLTHPKNSMEKTATVNFTVDEVIDAKTHNAKKRLKKNFNLALAAKTGLAGGGYLAARKLFGKDVANKSAAVSLSYISASTIKDFTERQAARDYLASSRAHKIAMLRDEAEEHRITPETIYKAVMLNKAL